MTSMRNNLKAATKLESLYSGLVYKIDEIVERLPHPTDIDYPTKESGAAAIELDENQKKLGEVRQWLAQRCRVCRDARLHLERQQRAAEKKAQKAKEGNP